MSAPYPGRSVRSRSTRGATTVELAAATFVTLLIVLVILDGARLINAYSTVAHAARVGVRYAAVRGAESGDDGNRPTGDAPATPATVTAFVRSRIPHIEIDVTTSWPEAGGAPQKEAGNILELTVESDFEPVVPWFPAITVASTSRMVIFY